MRTFDPTPLWRSTIGFDGLFDLLNASSQWTAEDHYPLTISSGPAKITTRSRSRWPALLLDEVIITAEQNVLTVEGAKLQKNEHQYLYQGISARPFRRVFNLADYVQVRGASFTKGLLKIELVREIPEAIKPRWIAINTGKSGQQIEQKQAA